MQMQTSSVPLLTAAKLAELVALGHNRISQIYLHWTAGRYAQLYDDNGTSSLNLAKPPTNVVNGLGVFTGINADTLLIQVNEN